MRRALLLLVGLSWLPSAQAQTERPAAPTAPAEPAAAAGPKVTLMEAGSKENRRELRFRLRAGSEETMVMRMKMDMSMVMDGKAMPAPAMPVMVMTAAIKVVSIEESGDIHYTMTYAEPTLDEVDGIDPAVLEQLKKSLGSMSGLSGEVTVSSHGIVRSGRLQPTKKDPMLDSMVDSMNQSIQQMSSPTPLEPVGVGAKWKVESRPKVGGFEQKLTMVYTLKEFTPEGAKLEAEMEQTAEPQDMHLPNMPEGSSARLQSLKGKGKGTSEISTTHVVPVAASVKTNADVEMSIDAGGHPMSIKQKVEMQLNISSTPPKPAR